MKHYLAGVIVVALTVAALRSWGHNHNPRKWDELAEHGWILVVIALMIGGSVWLYRKYR